MGILRQIALGTVALLVSTAGAVALSTGTASGQCGTSTIPTGATSTLGAVAGYTGDQLANAVAIVNAGTALGVSTQGDIIGVMTAIGESGLRNLTYGDNLHGVTNPDGMPTDSVGLFQQQHWWGPLAIRMDPGKAAGLFFQRLLTLPGWETMPPTAAAHAIQRNADPNHYTPFYSAAAQIVGALISSAGGGACTISGDAQAIAQQLVQAADTGRLSGSVPDHIKEIRWIAQGRIVPNCGIDIRILQVLLLAVQHFDRVQVSDINRACTGQIAGLGTKSLHYIDGGGRAVDFLSLNGQHLTGADGLSLRLIALLDPVMPTGAHVGQRDCRALAGDSVATTRWTQVDDYCTHLHVDVGSNGSPLTIQ
jgi:hypothetical protein